VSFIKTKDYIKKNNKRIRIRCPKCHRLLNLKQDKFSSEIACIKCKRFFIPIHLKPALSANEWDDEDKLVDWF